MRVLLFDTETNGLPKNFRAPPHNVDNWPVIASIAWQLWELPGTGAAATAAAAAEAPLLLEKYSTLVKPSDDVVWDEEAVKIHTITKARAQTEGIEPSAALNAFKDVCRRAHLIVAHNLRFDKSVVFAATIRQNTGTTFEWWPRLEYCSCEGTKSVCKLPGVRPTTSDPYKMPKLTELYTHLFGNTASVTFHSAEGDVECLTQCFHELVRRRLVPLDVWARFTGE
jgi:DNA polymerase III epsilon subunit-like protein